MIAARCSSQETVHLSPIQFGSLSTAAASPQPLAWFRVGLAGVLVAQALSLIGHLEELFGRYGIVAWSVMTDDLPPAMPNLSWVEEAVSVVRLPAGFAIPLAFALYVGALLSLLLGYRTRLAAGVAWLTHTAFMISGEISMYGVDRFAQIGLFYCLWFPVGHGLSWDAAAGRVNAAPSFEAWLGLRILQAHVTIAYFASGVEKSLGEQWWNGEAVWRAVMSTHDPPFDCSFIATIPGLALGLGWMTLVLEIGAIALVWHPCTRRLWLVGIVGMHLGIALVMNLWTFSATMVVFDIGAFGFLPRRRLHEEANCAAGRGRHVSMESWPNSAVSQWNGVKVAACVELFTATSAASAGSMGQSRRRGPDPRSCSSPMEIMS
jgi:hypothetical protein